MQQVQQKNNFVKSIYPWIVILISSLFLIYRYILQVSPSIMTNKLMRVFHLDAVGLGDLAATFFFSYFFTQLFVGVILDRFSTRLIVAFAIFVSALGAYFFAHADTLFIAQLGRAMMGFGAAFATVSYLKLAAIWFPPRRFAFVSGLLATAAMIGAIFGEAPLSLLVSHVGWRQSLVYCALIGFVLAALYVLIIRDPGHRDYLLEKSPSQPKLTLQDIAGVLLNKQNWFLTLYSGMAFAPIAVFGGLWGNPFLMEAHHLSSTEAASLISLVFLGLAAGAPLLGWLSDQLGNRRLVMFFGTFTALIALTLIIYVDKQPIWLMGFLMFIFGFGTGAFMLGFALGKEINKPHLAATVIALINSGDAIFGWVSQPLVGKFLDLGWTGRMKYGVRYYDVHNFHMALLLLPIYLALACIFVFFLQESPVKKLEIESVGAKEVKTQRSLTQSRKRRQGAKDF